MHHCSEPPLSKTIFLARMGKEDVEGEGVGGEVCASGNLRFSRWFWFIVAPCSIGLVRYPMPYPPYSACSWHFF